MCCGRREFKRRKETNQNCFCLLWACHFHCFQTKEIKLPICTFHVDLSFSFPSHIYTCVCMLYCAILLQYSDCTNTALCRWVNYIPFNVLNCQQGGFIEPVCWRGEIFYVQKLVSDRKQLRDCKILYVKKNRLISKYACLLTTCISHIAQLLLWHCRDS